MKRRNFLKLAGVGSIAALIGSGVFRVTWWWRQPTAESMEVLSRDEVEITEAVLDAMFPGDSEAYKAHNRLPNGRETDALGYFDRYLSWLDARSANLLRLLLHAIDDVAFLRGFKFKRFRNRDREQRIAILKAWDQSNVGVRRSAFRAMKMALAGGYLNAPAVKRATGVEFFCNGSGEMPTALRPGGGS